MRLTILSFQLRLLLAIISGALVIPLSLLDKFTLPKIFGLSIIDISIGLVFGLLVMIPFLKSLNWLKAILMILASIAIYTSVSYFAKNQYHIFSLDLGFKTSIILSGSLGALLTGAAMQLFSSLNLKLISYALLMVFGAMTGYIFSICIDSNSIYINALGYIIWQTTVFLILSFTKK